MQQTDTMHPKEISIVELEQELAADEAVDEAFRDTLEMPVPNVDEEITPIYEITPTKLARWDGAAVTFFVPL